MELKILTQKQVCEITTLSRQGIYLLERDGKFPKRIALTPGPRGKKGWYEHEVKDWLNTRVRGFIGRS